MRIIAAGIFISAFVGVLIAAGTPDIKDLGATGRLPTFEARLGIGFNYDLLHDPFDVSFEYPKGYFGFNLPLEYNVNVMDYKDQINRSIDSMIQSYGSVFENMDEFKPTVGARQNTNPSIRVDVPMLGGVGSFSNTQNFYINYQNTLGNPNIFINPSPDSLIKGMSFMLRGTVNVPISMTATWETMTFGYAFEVNKMLKLALNLHRHVFVLDMRGKIDVDLLGRYNISMTNNQTSGFEMPTINGEIDYPSSKISGNAYGHYKAEVWTPTLGVQAWRFSCISRFGINTRAHGNFMAKYSLPFFVDPETFQLKYDLQDPEVLNNSEVRQGLLANAADSITYSTRKKAGATYSESDLIWKMPTGLTFSFDVVKDKVKLSYTKLFGEVAMKLDRIAREQRTNDTTSQVFNDSLVIDYGFSVDHVMMLEVNLFHSFLNIGVFSFDFRYADSTHLIGKQLPASFKFGNAALLPVISFGSALGTKMQLLLELDVLPLPAVKTGLNYYF